MKIPETSANIGAYYGNEENGQWQPNGVIIDNGVGGGIVGSGDAGVHRPPLYPVHIPRHMPGGYVMAGAFYPPQFAPPAPPPPDNFEDYMWMENEEEFDKQVIQQLQEEELMEQCIEAMLEDENRERRGGNRRPRDPQAPTTSSCNGNPSISLEEAVSRSTLNPLAAEFVPTRVRLPPSTTTNTNTDIKAESAEAPSTEEPSSTDAASDPDRAPSKPDPTEQVTTEASLTPPKDPPEVSAADLQPIKDTKSKPRDVKKPEPKKPAAKVEVKKLKPVVVKSEPKVQPKKKEVKEIKPVKSEAKVEDAVKSEDAVDNVPKPQLPTPAEEPAVPGLKPINYAAAAKASKPKPKAASPPTAAPLPVEKPLPAVDKKREEKKPSRDKPKEKPVPRKNSVK